MRLSQNKSGIADTLLIYNVTCPLLKLSGLAIASHICVGGIEVV
ncbi:MAG: hypothetical protein V7K67_34095 [Nostoc sp.]